MRPSLDSYMLAIAHVVATRSTCQRRAVGCVIVDLYGRILATGYNGVAAGRPHCNESREENNNEPTHRCSGASSASGEQLDACQAIHAEQNTLVWCRAPDQIKTTYTTTPPCISCVKLLLSTSCQRVVTTGTYPQAALAKALWEAAGRFWLDYPSKQAVRLDLTSRDDPRGAL